MNMNNISVWLCSMKYLGEIHTKTSFIVYLRFKFNWMSYILSGSPSSDERNTKTLEAA